LSDGKRGWDLDERWSDVGQESECELDEREREIIMALYQKREGFTGIFIKLFRPETLYAARWNCALVLKTFEMEIIVRLDEM
jgi:hypothetical protein